MGISYAFDMHELKIPARASNANLWVVIVISLDKLLKKIELPMIWDSIELWGGVSFPESYKHFIAYASPHTLHGRYRLVGWLNRFIYAVDNESPGLEG